MDTSRQDSIGLLGSIEPDTISHAIMPETTEELPAEWLKGEIIPCGTFHVATQARVPSAEELALLDDIILGLGSAKNQTTPVHLVIWLDTKGCLETEAYSVRNGQTVPIPLLMLEDGQTRWIS